MTPELLIVPARQVLLIVNLLAEHLLEVLVGCLVLSSHQFLTELVHKVSGHPYDFGLIKVILDPLEVVIVVLVDIPLQVFILPFQHHVHIGIHGFHALVLLG